MPAKFSRHFIYSYKEWGCGVLYKVIYKNQKYILMLNDEHLGEAKISKTLTKNSERFGGHFQYKIYSQCRNKGHGIVFFKLLLDKCAKMGIKTAFITCPEHSIGFRKIIEYNEGKLFDRISYKSGKYYVSIRRYLVNTGYEIKEVLGESFSLNVENMINIYGKEISLELDKIYGKNSNAIESYVYSIKDRADNVVGRISFIAGISEDTYYRGNIGYNIVEKYRGNNYAQIATKMLINVLCDNGYKYDFVITVNPDNLASKRICENLGAKLLEIVELPQHSDMYEVGERYKYRYIIVNL